MRQSVDFASEPKASAAASYGEDFLAYVVEPDDFGAPVLLKVATHRVADLSLKLGPIVRLSENGNAERTSHEPSVWRFLNEEYQFAHNLWIS
jgi:hypothetical protein